MELANLSLSGGTKHFGKPSNQVVEEIVSSVNVSLNKAALFTRNTFNICMVIIKLHKTGSVFGESLQQPPCGFVSKRELPLAMLGSFVKEWHQQANILLSKKLLLQMVLPENLPAMLWSIENRFVKKEAGLKLL